MKGNIIVALLSHLKGGYKDELLKRYWSDYYNKTLSYLHSDNLPFWCDIQTVALAAFGRPTHGSIELYGWENAERNFTFLSLFTAYWSHLNCKPLRSQRESLADMAVNKQYNFSSLL